VTVQRVPERTQTIGRPVVLDWRAGHNTEFPRPCVLCGRPTTLVSPRGKHCHKTCAEAWTEQYRPDQPPTFDRQPDREHDREWSR